MTDYSKMTQADFDKHLNRIVDNMSGHQVLSIPGVHEIVTEFLNNDVLDAWAEANPELANPPQWETFCKRTNEPKLLYIEAVLSDNGIPNRREGESWHAPILKVPADKHEVAWRLLNESVGVTGWPDFDEIPDDDPMFDDYRSECDE